ncbi:MAG: ribonuclease HII [Promethearchaeota archaeon]
MNSFKTSKINIELSCGIDEAGRGPVLGPMLICGVCFTKSGLDFLKEIGVKDSKKLSPKKRTELAKLIVENCHSYKMIIVSAKEIDQRKEKKITLNRLEELKMAEIINELKPDIIYLDAADVNEKRFGVSIKKLLKYNPKKIISKHKADDTYPIVSAASIIAKNKRDALINDLKKKYGDLGSGYPSDEKTTTFLHNWIKKNKKVPHFARATWSTTRKILTEELENKKITDYLK